MGINKTIGCLVVALALGYQAQAKSAFAIKVQKDSTSQTAKVDTTKAKKPMPMNVKPTPPKKETDYERLMKDSGTVVKGLFTVRHIKDKWYFEMHDSMVGRYFMAVTRFASVPQGFGKFSGEMVTKTPFTLKNATIKPCFCAHLYAHKKPTRKIEYTYR